MNKNNTPQKSDRKQLIISRCFDCYVEKGLENITIRDLAAAADVNLNTLYYHFNSKSGLLIECVDYGFSLLEDSLFDALNRLDDNSDDVFPDILNVAISYAPQIRFLLQAVASPTFCGYRENQIKNNTFYDRLGEELAYKFACPYNLIKDYIHEIITLLSYYSLWGSSAMASMQFNRIFTDFKVAINKHRNHF